MSTQSPYRIDVINAAMGAPRLSNDRLGKKAGVSTMTVSRIRMAICRLDTWFSKKQSRHLA